MIKRHSRIPAALVLVAAIALAGVYLFAWNRLARAQTSSRALDQLESLIAAGRADAAIWDAYGQKLQELKRYDRAVAAYHKALEIEPLHRDARFHCAIALVEMGDREATFIHMRDLVIGDPKLAEDLFERPEMRACLAEARFAALAKEAHVQAMD